MENKPVIQNRDRGLSISIFKREKDGITSYGACLQRSWRDKTTDEWKREQINLFPDELLKLTSLCARTYTDAVIYAQNNQSKDYPAQAIDEAIPF